MICAKLEHTTTIKQKKEQLHLMMFVKSAHLEHLAAIKIVLYVKHVNLEHLAQKIRVLHVLVVFLGHITT